MIKVFVSGQSNALGRGTGGPSFSGVSTDVSVWNNVNPLGSNGSAFVTASAAQAAGVFENTDRNNAAVWFCDKLARAAFDTVTMTIVARGATPISAWAPTEVTTPMLPECLAVWAATGQAAADVFVWQHGEGDTSLPAADYQAAFLALLNNLASAGVISSSTIVLISGLLELGPGRYAFNRNVLTPLVSKRIHHACVSAYLLPSEDGTHLTGPALYKLGAQRFYAAWKLAAAKLS